MWPRPALRHSARNGEIRIIPKFWGKATVVVDGCEQTGKWTHRMWINAFKRVRNFEKGRISRVLMIGLGGGGEIAKIHRRFPGAHLTVIEHDPEMVALAKDLKL